MKAIFKFMRFVFLFSLISMTLTACGSGGDGSGIGFIGSTGVSTDAGASSSPTYITNDVNEVSATVTASGGTVECTNAASEMFRAKIVIPEGALDTDTVISLKKIDQAVAIPDAVEGGVVIDFGPDGTVFKENIVVTIPYEDADNDGIVDYTDTPEGELAIIYWDSIEKKWITVDNIISRDTVNNTITFETNHFSKYTTMSICYDKRNDKVFIFTIDGLNFNRTIGHIIFDIIGSLNFQFKLLGDVNFEARDTGYLRKRLLKTNMLEKCNCYSFGGNTDDDSWSGDATKTSSYISSLSDRLREKAREAKNRDQKFVVVTHSWGTQLGTIGLSKSGVIPDLFITLSDPEGSMSVEDDTYVFKLIPYAKVSDVELMIGGFVQHYGVGEYSPISLYARQWINYWHEGDIISGPLSYKDEINGIKVENLKVNASNKKRNYDNTQYMHAITGLLVDDSEGISFRDKVVSDIKNICKVIVEENLDANGDGTIDGVSKYEYDNGKLIKIKYDSDNDGNTDAVVKYTYESKTGGTQMIQKFDNNNDGNTDAVTTTEYNNKGYMTKQTIDYNNDGRAEQIYMYTYESGYLTELMIYQNVVGAQDLMNKYKYDAKGNLITAELDMGNNGSVDGVTRYIYDSLGRVIRLEGEIGGVVHSVIKYEYDPYVRGNVIKQKYDSDNDGSTDFAISYKWE